ncbi:MAG: hypothetical protein M3071_14020, partial [Actinomycetota bacterium]|nr:hypothetical protein [Actinomycetota bacterium]
EPGRAAAAQAGAGALGARTNLGPRRGARFGSTALATYLPGVTASDRVWWLLSVLFATSLPDRVLTVTVPG